jgi:hypothetical protein
MTRRWRQADRPLGWMLVALACLLGCQPDRRWDVNRTVAIVHCR